MIGQVFQPRPLCPCPSQDGCAYAEVREGRESGRDHKRMQNMHACKRPPAAVIGRRPSACFSRFITLLTMVIADRVVWRAKHRGGKYPGPRGLPVLHARRRGPGCVAFGEKERCLFTYVVAYTMRYFESVGVDFGGILW